MTGNGRWTSGGCREPEYVPQSEGCETIGRDTPRCSPRMGLQCVAVNFVWRLIRSLKWRFCRSVCEAERTLLHPAEPGRSTAVHFQVEQPSNAFGLTRFRH